MRDFMKVQMETKNTKVTRLKILTEWKSFFNRVDVKKNTKHKKHKKNKEPIKWKTYLKRGSIGCAVALICTICLSMLYITKRLSTLPIVDAQYLKTYETSKILDKNGDIIWQPSDVRVDTFTYEEIPTIYRDALIMIEDKDFWTNHGFSIEGVANMVYSTVRSKFDSDYVARGGSTIDQQLIKNKFYNRGEGYDTTTRKIQELFLSRQLDENFTKEEILTFYINDLMFSNGSQGTKAIMRTYFNKSPDDYKERTIENISEQAYLAGLSQAPTRYSLYNDVEAATKRRNTVLQTLREENYITNDEYEKACEFDLTTNLQPENWESEKQVEKNRKYKVYTDEVRKEVASYGYNLDEVSLTIQTYLDPVIFDTITNTARDPKYYLDGEQQIAVTVMDKDGIVVGMVGSRNDDDELNRATQQTRSSGSSMKPFTAYGPLLQYFGNDYNTGSLFDTSNYQYPGSSAIMYNYGQYVYGMQTMQQSLRLSLNTPVARIDDGILGSGRMKSFLHGVGLDTKDTYSSVDGIGINVSTLQSAAAYNALNNLGTYTKPRFVSSITFQDGSTKEIAPTKNKAMNESTAWVLNHILQGVPQTNMTAPSATIPQYAGYAGKTGSVAFDSAINAPAPYGVGGSDAWYNSYTNGGYTVSVWTGYDIPNTSPQVPDSYKGQQILNRDLQLILNGQRSVPAWNKPDTVTLLSGSGLSAHYKVTDSSDVNVNSAIGIDLSQYDALLLDKAIPNTDIPTDWEKDEGSVWFEYYRSGKSSQSPIVDKDAYDRMKGDD